MEGNDRSMFLQEESHGSAEGHQNPVNALFHFFLIYFSHNLSNFPSTPSIETAHNAILIF